MTNSSDSVEDTTTRTLAAILTEAIDRRRSGESPAPEEYIVRHPELEAKIRGQFQVLELLEGKSLDARAAPDGDTAQSSERGVPLGEAIAKLPEEVQRLILLRNFEHLKWLEIAHRVGAPASALQRQYARAIRTLVERCAPVRGGGMPGA